MTNDVVVIGGGAAGVMAACTAAEQGHRVLLIEKNERIGRKVMITGKGRCNVTNATYTVEELLENIPVNPRFLYSAFHCFMPVDTMELFEGLGVPLKVERGNRVFPVSDKAVDIVDALDKLLKQTGVHRLHDTVKHILVEDGVVTGVETEQHGRIDAFAVILATGGLSYPRTGSTGDGYRMAKEVGHTVTEIVPSLVPMTSDDPSCADMQGLSLRNVSVSVVDVKTGKTVYSDFGEMLFTHFGVSGPVILSASSHLHELQKGEYELRIDLKPALSDEQLEARLLRDFEANSNKDFRNSLGDLLPKSMIPVFLRKTGVNPYKKVNQITAKNGGRSCIHCGNSPSRSPGSGRGGSHRHVRRCAGEGSGPEDHGVETCRGTVLRRRDLDVDALHGRVQSSNRVFDRSSGRHQRLGVQYVQHCIDGPAGAGKSSIARAAAANLGFIYVDTGALYRTVALAALKQGLQPEEKEKIVALLPDIDVSMGFVDGEQRVFLNGEDVSEDIRLPEVSAAASTVSAIPEVRQFLFDLQRDMAKTNDVLMDGRDIGTVVLPDAQLKIFLTATPEERARRRYEQIKDKSDVTYEEVLKDLNQRDYQDTHREIAPLKQADDAVLLDTTNMSFEEVVKAIEDLAKERQA